MSSRKKRALYPCREDGAVFLVHPRNEVTERKPRALPFPGPAGGVAPYRQEKPAQLHAGVRDLSRDGVGVHSFRIPFLEVFEKPHLHGSRHCPDEPHHRLSGRQAWGVPLCGGRGKRAKARGRLPQILGTHLRAIWMGHRGFLSRNPPASGEDTNRHKHEERRQSYLFSPPCLQAALSASSTPRGSSPRAKRVFLLCQGFLEGRTTRPWRPRPSSPSPSHLSTFLCIKGGAAGREAPRGR